MDNFLLFRPNPITSPPTSHHTEPMYKATPATNKTYEYYLTQSAQQQPIYIGQRYFIMSSIFKNNHHSIYFSPSLEMSSKYNENHYSGTTSLNDPRPTSATSSIRSQDSGVAQSDPKTSIDCSAKSESSPKISLNNSDNHYLSMGRHKLSSSEFNQNLFISHSEQNFNINPEQIREKLQPLNTQRLKVLRQATKSFIVC